MTSLIPVAKGEENLPYDHFITVKSVMLSDHNYRGWNI